MLNLSLHNALSGKPRIPLFCSEATNVLCCQSGGFATQTTLDGLREVSRPRQHLSCQRVGALVCGEPSDIMRGLTQSLLRSHHSNCDAAASRLWPEEVLGLAVPSPT